MKWFLSKKVFTAILYAVIFIASLLVYTHNNRFPFYYHTTEPSKIEQITTHEYNLFHPLMMLNSAHVVVAITGAQSEQEIVTAGRWVSALYASASVLILMAIAQLLFGLPGAFSSGVLMVFSPMMIRLSHYFKEDPTFIFGVMLSILAVAIYYRKPSSRSFLFMIIAMTLAASGKYVGFALLPMGIFVAATIPYADSKGITVRRRIGRFLSVFIGLYLVLNFQMILRLPYIIRTAAAKHHDGIVALSGHGGAMVTHPWLDYIKCFFSQTHVVIPILVLCYFVYFAITYRKRSAVEKFIVAFFFFFTFLLSLGKVASGQYFLPQEMLSHMLAGIILVIMLTPLKTHWGNRVFIPSLVATLILVGFLLFPYARNSLRQFDPKEDTRKDFVGWMEHNDGTRPMKIASDMYVLLPRVVKDSTALSADKNLTIKEMEYTGDLKSLANAERLGFTHIAVCDDTFGRFFSQGNSAGAGSVYETRKNFYQELFEKGTLLWKAQAEYGGVVNTPIRFYQLPSAHTIQKETQQ